MDFPQLQRFIDRSWDADILPALADYIAIPCLSPAFDPDWAASGHMDRAAESMAQWARGSLDRQLPFARDTQPVNADIGELMLNRAWRPQLTVTGIDGLPGTANAAAVMQPATALKLSLRLPPTLDPHATAMRMKTLLEADPPYGCAVSFEVQMVSQGWHAPASAPWLDAALQQASQ